MNKLKYTLNALIIALIVFSTGCKSSSKLLETGQYDLAVTKAVAKVQKDRNDQKNIDVLVKAFPKANDKNIENINFLQKEGRADRWEGIYHNYVELKTRQDLVNTVMPLKYNGSLLQFETNDYVDKIIEAKKNAGDYFYNRAKSLMAENSKQSYRNAYNNFENAKKYSAAYNDINQLEDDCLRLGTDQIITVIDNQTRYKLSPDFEQQLLSLDYQNLDGNWIQHTAGYGQYTLNNFDYAERIVLKNFAISPERVTSKVYTETKKVRDGWSYEYDNKGNVKKDSLGNDIKIPKYKTVRCDVVETYQSKDIVAEAFVDIYKNSTRKLIKSYPFRTEGHFENIYRVAQGDIEALSEETRKTLGGQPVPFPDDFQMMYDAIPAIRSQVMPILKQAQTFYE